MTLLRGTLQDGTLIGGVHVINFTGGGATVTSRRGDGGVNIDIALFTLVANVETLTAGDGLDNSGTATDPVLDVNVGNGITVVSDQVEPDYGVATNKVCGGDDSRIPTQDENDALVGTDGTPSSTNKYVTNSDSRLTDSRAPDGAGGGDLSPTTPADDYPAPKVVKLQGRDVATTAPNDEECLKWVAGTSKWTPGALGASAGVDSIVAGDGLGNSGTAADPILDVNVGNGVTIVSDNLEPDYGAVANKVCEGDDSRLTDVRTPTTHATAHEVGGSDELTGDLDANARARVSIGGVLSGTRREINFKAGGGISILQQNDSSGEKVDVTVNSTISIQQPNLTSIGSLLGVYDVFGLSSSDSPLKTALKSDVTLDSSLMYVCPIRFEADFPIRSAYVFFKDTSVSSIISFAFYDANGDRISDASAINVALGGGGTDVFKLNTTNRFGFRVTRPIIITAGLYYIGFTNAGFSGTGLSIPALYWDSAGSPDLVANYGTVPTSGGVLVDSFNPSVDITDRNGSTYPFAPALFFSGLS